MSFFYHVLSANSVASLDSVPDLSATYLMKEPFFSPYSIFPATRSVAQPGSLPEPQPMDIRRMVGAENVFIPCPFEFRSTPSIWRINGTDYTASTLPSIYRLAPSGLLIKTVHRCLNQTSFQCIDTSSTSLREEVSDIGVLTVTGEEICKGKLITRRQEQAG